MRKTHKTDYNTNKIRYAKSLSYGSRRHRFFGIRTLSRISLPHHFIPHARFGRTWRISDRAHCLRRIFNGNLERTADNALSRDIKTPHARQQKGRTLRHLCGNPHYAFIQRPDYRTSLFNQNAFLARFFRSALRRSILHSHYRTFLYLGICNHPRLFLGKQALFCILPHRADRRNNYDRHRRHSNHRNQDGRCRRK